MRLNWRNTFLIGLGFFSVSVVWPIYNAYIPLLYDKFIPSDALKGFVMTIDNWLALTLTPLVGYMSDRTRTRFGRRIPYLLVGAPLAALFLALIPLGWSVSLGLLLTFTILMNLAMASFRSPIIALMPDVTPAPLRSQANGIINFMGGLGYIFATAVGALLYRRYPGYPFFAAAAMLVAVALAFFLWIREPAGATEQSERYRYGFVKDRNALFLLLAIFCWFVGYNGVETWWTTYGTKHLGQEAAKVAGLLTYSGGAFLLMAIPAGWIAAGAGRWKGLGRKRTILAGLVGMAAAYLLMQGLTDLRRAVPLLVLAGLSWAWVNINSYPMITQMAPAGQIGTYTGLYYLFSNGANIASPPLFGWVFDHFGYRYFFPLAVLFMALAFGFMLLVRRGEAADGAEAAAD
jgi:maltose/moltooligosaccharide transporter